MNNFKYAYERIVNKTEAFDNTDRDLIFSKVLSLFNGGSVDIFQVGAIETFDERWRYGSGWSDIIFGNYIKNNGGSLTICDIHLDNIANSYFAASHMGYKINFELADAGEIISGKDYDIYYLDGGNDPNETEKQFNSITAKKCAVIIDDLLIKGVTLMDNIDFNHKYKVANGVGLILKGF